MDEQDGALVEAALRTRRQRPLALPVLGRDDDTRGRCGQGSQGRVAVVRRDSETYGGARIGGDEEERDSGPTQHVCSAPQVVLLHVEPDRDHWWNRGMGVDQGSDPTPGPTDQPHTPHLVTGAAPGRPGEAGLGQLHFLVAAVRTFLGVDEEATTTGVTALA